MVETWLRENGFSGSRKVKHVCPATNLPYAGEKQLIANCWTSFKEEQSGKNRRRGDSQLWTIDINETGCYHAGCVCSIG